MDLAILLFDNITPLDAIGPNEVLRRVPDLSVHFVVPEPGIKTADDGVLAMRDDERVLAWLRRAHETTRWTTSVCTGALVLAAAGGVSSGIDMALTLAARLAGEVAQGIQLAIEYGPQPPFDAGSPATAPAHLVEHQRTHSRFNR